MVSTSKIIFNETAAKAAEQIAEKTVSTTKRIVFKTPETAKPETFESLRKTIIPFYNKFLPKFLRKTTQVEFYPKTNAIKAKNVYNHKDQIIRSELFDELGNRTYFEKYNPRTGRSFTRVKSEGKIIEQEMKGSVLLRKQEIDGSGKTIYKYTFDAKKGIKTVEDYDGCLYRKVETVGGKQVYKFQQKTGGGFCEEYANIGSPRRYICDIGYVKYKDGSLSKSLKYTKVEVFNDKSGVKSVYEYVPDERQYIYTEFDVDGKACTDPIKVSKDSLLQLLTAVRRCY